MAVRGLLTALLSPGGLFSSGGLCTDQDRLTVRAKWRQAIPPLMAKFSAGCVEASTKPRELLRCSFNEVTLAASWQISRPDKSWGKKQRPNGKGGTVLTKKSNYVSNEFPCKTPKPFSNHPFSRNCAPQ